MSGFGGMVSLRAPLTVDNTQQTSLGELAGATFDETLISNPSVAYYREKFLDTAYDVGADVITRDNALQQIKSAGLEGRLQIPDQGIPRIALDTLIDRKRDEVKRQQVLANAPSGIASGSVRLAVGLGGSLLDPLNVAAGFFPAVGEARYAQMLGKSAGILRRTAVRAAVGAVEGTAGTAAIEPIVYSSKQLDQADYDMGDSIANIAFGGVFGAGLHTVGGATGDLFKFALGSAGDVASKIAPETRAQALKTAVAQAASGQSVNVEPLVKLDPAAERMSIPRAENLSPAYRNIETNLSNKIASNVDAAIEEYSKLPDAEGGRVLNTDLARELSPEYRADRTRSAAVQEPASFLVKEMYARKLTEEPAEGQLPLVVFTAGGTGAGKSSAIAALSQSADELRQAQIVYDTNLNSLKSSVQKIEQALDAGKRVQLFYVARDPVTALTQGSLTRAMRMGRTVPLTEHARTHVGSAEVLHELARRYRHEPSVDIHVIDNTGSKDQVRLGSIDQVKPLEYTQLVGELHAALEKERSAGRISEAVYRSTLGDETRFRERRGVQGARQAPGASDDRQFEETDRRRPIDLSEVRAAAEKPQPSSLADDRASQAADEQLKAASTKDDFATVQEELAEELARLKETADSAGIEIDPEELAPYDEAIKDAKAYGRAVRAAVICGLRHTS